MLTENPESPSVAVTPNLLAGMVSPLWTYYAALTTAGLAFWGLARFSQPANLEAAFEPAPPTAAVDPIDVPPEASLESIDPAIEPLAETPIETAVEVSSDLGVIVAAETAPIEIVKPPKALKTAAATPTA